MAVRVALPLRRRALAPLVAFIGTTRASLRRLREDAPVIAGVLAVVALASFVFAAVPRALNETADDGLRYAVTQAGPLGSDVEVLKALSIPLGPANDPFAGSRRAGSASRACSARCKRWSGAGRSRSTRLATRSSAARRRRGRPAI